MFIAHLHIYCELLFHFCFFQLERDDFLWRISSWLFFFFVLFFLQSRLISNRIFPFNDLRVKGEKKTNRCSIAIKETSRCHHSRRLFCFWLWIWSFGFFRGRQRHEMESLPHRPRLWIVERKKKQSNDGGHCFRVEQKKMTEWVNRSIVLVQKDLCYVCPSSNNVSSACLGPPVSWCLPRAKDDGWWSADEDHCHHFFRPRTAVFFVLLPQFLINLECVQPGVPSFTEFHWKRECSSKLGSRDLCGDYFTLPW